MTKLDMEAPKESPKEVCGIIMPISSTDNYLESHWAEVKSILEEVIHDAGFTPNLVSDANDVSIIHTRIVGNISENPIMICDVSSKNPNVMFELGLRLAFDKPTIIIKDTLTDYSFDTSPIEHLTYPRDLRYKAINEFKVKLKSKLVETYNKGKEKGYSTFLKHFIKLKPKLEEQEVSLMTYIQQEFNELRNTLTVQAQKPAPALPTLRREMILDYVQIAFSDWADKFSPPKNWKEMSASDITEYCRKHFLATFASRFPDVNVSERDSRFLIYPIVNSYVHQMLIGSKENGRRAAPPSSKK